MSMIVTCIVPDGVVMAADSASTHYRFADMKNIFTDNYEQAAKNAQMGLIPPTPENVLSQSTGSRYTNKIHVMRNKIAFIHGSSMGGDHDVQLNPYVDNFCLKNNYGKPKDAAEELLKYLRGKFPNHNATFMVGGYIDDEDLPYAETFVINIKENSIEQMSGKGQYGLLFASANDYFSNFRELINRNIKLFALQDAIDVTMWAFDVSMKCERFIDFKRAIWPPIDILAITPEGVQWVQKKKLEVKGYAVC